MRWGARAVCALALGCSEPPASDDPADTDLTPEDACPSGEPGVRLVSEERDYGRGRDQGLTLVHGPQGGWHIWAELQGVCHLGDRVTVALSVVDEATEAVVGGQPVPFTVALGDYAGCCGGVPPVPAYVSDVSALAWGTCDTPPEVLAGRRVCLVATVTGAIGLEVGERLCGPVILDAMDAPCAEG